MAKQKNIKIYSNPIIRITPEEILESFNKINLNAIRGESLNKNGVDGLTAFWIRCGMDCGRSIEEIIGYEEIEACWELKNYGMYDINYLAGFTRGWDGGDLPSLQIESYVIGYNDGKESWKRVSKI